MPSLIPVHPAAAGRAKPWLVADTQVVLDWLVFRNNAARPLLAAVLADELRWVATGAMRAELARMLSHPVLARWGHQAEQALTFFDTRATLLHEVAPNPAPRLICSDPDDQVFVDTALAHGATWLATRDRALLKLRRKALRYGLQIVRPDQWQAAGHPAP